MKPYPPIEDYGFIADGHSVALVSRWGSIDWCCLGQIDTGSCFGRLLDWRLGGHFAIAPESRFETTRRYLDGTLVLETRFRCDGGEAVLTDAFAMRKGGREDIHCLLVRTVEGVSGTVPLSIELSPRFDYGDLRPWIRRHDRELWSAIGGEIGLVIASDVPLSIEARHDLCARIELREGERRRFLIRSQPAYRLHPGEPEALDPRHADRHVDQAIAWWRRWSGKAHAGFPRGDEAVRSAIVLKGLTSPPTGAIAAAATTSLPEHMGGERNWDYRFSWIRDSSFALQSLLSLGYEKEAIGFRYFLERSTAGNIDELEIMYGVDGRQRLTEVELSELDGYRGSRPVRIGNAAHTQRQLDIYGDLLETAWRSAMAGAPPSDEYWEFLVQVVDEACRRWKDPDHGIWETRGGESHFVHSKVSCWAACEHGVQLAERLGRGAPVERWRKEQKAIRAEVEARGVDPERDVYVRALDSRDLDASLLLLPRMGFVPHDDPRMRRTVDAIRQDLCENGLIRRYRTADGLHGHEGTFVACSFWLVECLAGEGRWDEAEAAFERACVQRNDLGLFAEEYDPVQQTMLGNFPQGLSHYSHIAALVALARRHDGAEREQPHEGGGDASSR